MRESFKHGDACRLIEARQEAYALQVTAIKVPDETL